MVDFDLKTMILSVFRAPEELGRAPGHVYLLKFCVESISDTFRTIGDGLARFSDQKSRKSGQGTTSILEYYASTLVTTVVSSNTKQKVSS